MAVLEEFANDPEKYEYYRARQYIELIEQSNESEYRQIREDYQQAVEQLDNETQLKEQALAENHQLKLTLAKTLLEANNHTIEQIAQTTGLSVEQINQLI